MVIFHCYVSSPEAKYLIEGFQGSYLLRTDLDANHRLAQILPVNISSKLDAMAALIQCGAP